MVKYAMVPTTKKHVKALARNMRQADVDEVWATAHFTPLAAVKFGWQTSREVTTGLADGVVLCIFGIAQRTVMSDTGIPWMLTTHYLPLHARAVLRANKGWIERARANYPLLMNYVDVRNRVAIRWLEWLGFELFDPEPFGVERLPFQRFEMRTENV
tara:strand:+ start:7915 stop:8385 length:471 start_codon:yes stop_codon:yes gene_type:complete